MNIGALLEPLVVKAIEAKGYSRHEAVDRSWKWLAKELHVEVDALKFMDDDQEWHAHAVVERALLPPAKKIKKKIAMPAEPARAGAEMPLGASFWDGLRAEWGDVFFNAFFGDFTPVKVEGTLAPGQFVVEEIRKVNATALFDCA
ncbi:MAG TPA: hypothetical protein VN666_21730 [Nitrospira sp.]|nr:hypothetical protein [Nitrospira sp.]